jgi:PhnB protein
MELLEMVKLAFGAEEVERHEFSPRSCHVELRIGDSVLVIEAGELPPGVTAWVGSLYVYVEDVDAVYERALRFGISPLAPPQDKPYQERQAGFLDMAGNTWWIGSYRP